MSVDENNKVDDNSLFDIPLNKIKQKDYDLLDLSRDLKSITKRGYRLVIMVSEFDYLVNSLANNFDFASKLRAFIVEEFITPLCL